VEVFIHTEGAGWGLRFITAVKAERTSKLRDAARLYRVTSLNLVFLASPQHCRILVKGLNVNFFP
jgi:hypothetical protein